MRPVRSFDLVANRRHQAASHFAGIELRAARERAIKCAREARDVLRDAVFATGLPAFKAEAVYAAADSLAKAQAAVLGFDKSVDPEPADSGSGR